MGFKAFLNIYKIYISGGFQVEKITGQNFWSSCFQQVKQNILFFILLMLIIEETVYEL